VLGYLNAGMRTLMLTNRPITDTDVVLLRRLRT